MIAANIYQSCQKLVFLSLIGASSLLTGCFGGGDSDAPTNGGATVTPGPGETGSQRVSDVVAYLNGLPSSDSAEARDVAGVELVADDSAEPIAL